MYTHMRKKNTGYTGKRKGFSLYTIIIAIILVAIIAAITLPKIFSNYQMSNFKTTLHSDAESIIKAAYEWKADSPQSDGTWNNITTNSLCAYLPSNMQCVNGYITSSNYKGHIHYEIAPYKISQNGDSLKIFVNVTGGVLNTSSLREKAEIQGMDLLSRLSKNPDSVTEDGAATDIGDPNAAFKDGGTADDGMFGVSGIM